MPVHELGLRIAIGIATRGRADILRQTLLEIRCQTRRPERIVVCHTGPDDVTGLGDMAEVEFITAASGLPRQRNAILDHAGDCDVMLFLDDDFLMAPGYVEATAAAFAAWPDIVVTTGWTIADGARGPGFTPEAARMLIRGAAPPAGTDTTWPADHGYGCNMAIRLAAACTHGVRFDERLPLYGWSEDVDYTHRLGRHGRIVKLPAARGVHLGTKHGRTSGVRLGYSQVANPIYLFGKGSYGWRRAAGSVGRNLAANALKSLWSEPYIDRRGRLGGNALAFLDLLRGRLDPERVLSI
jgi:glycosyltransferase involved in cell wall biosynthesis